MLSNAAETVMATLLWPVVTWTGEIVVDTFFTVNGNGLLVPALVVTVRLRSPRGAEGSMTSVAVNDVALIPLTALTRTPVPVIPTSDLWVAKLVPDNVTLIVVPGNPRSGYMS